METALISLGADEEDSTPCPPHCSHSFLPTRNQLAESFSEMQFRCGYNNEKPAEDTDAPPGEWTPRPLSIQPVRQSLPIALTPLPFPASPPPLHPFQCAELTSARVSTHKGVPGLSMEVTAS